MTNKFRHSVCSLLGIPPEMIITDRETQQQSRGGKATSRIFQNKMSRMCNFLSDLLQEVHEHIYKDLHQAILDNNKEEIIKYGRKKIEGQFNEIMPAITLFDKHWDTLSPTTHEAIWKYLKVLCVLCERIMLTRA
jgi:transcriptional regulator CtsR